MLKDRRGVTLTELMVATVIMSVGILGFFGAFRFITISLYVSRTRTLATNLAQERVEGLKNLSYYELLITTASSTETSFTPGFTYDTANYPAETISIGGVTFTRYTFVSLAQIDSDVISTVTYTYPDTGMKLITVHVTWTDAGQKKKWSLSNLLENPNVNPLDASFSGTISKATGGALAGATVRVDQNPDWNATSDSSGEYTFRVYHGSYTIRASSVGYYDSVSAQAAASAGGSTSVSLTLTAIASGTIAGYAWINTHLVISQVVASTDTALGNGSTGRVEYVELFNPTTFPIDIGQTGSYPKSVSVNYYDEASGFDKLDSAAGFNFTHVSTYVPAGKYYLIANATTFMAAGAWRSADAAYNTSAMVNGFANVDYIRKDKAGAIRLLDSGGNAIDVVGWDDSNNTAPYYEGSSLPLASTDGLGLDNQIVRVSSPAASNAVHSTYGRAYDSGDNRNDFLYPTISGYTGINFAPNGTAQAAQTVIAGKPAVAAQVAASDPYSGSTQTYSAYVTSGSLSLLYAPFSLTGVTTGTWELDIASGTYYAQISMVVVTQGAVTPVPNAATVPGWLLSNHYAAVLSSDTVGGFLKGQVTGVSGVALSGIQILAGGTTKTTGANGTYFAAVTSGSVSVIANPNNADPSYVQQIAMPTVETGQMTTQNFVLSLGGSLQGYLTSATSPLPNFVVTANIGGNQYGSGTSNTSGVFTIRNLSTGTYTVQPVLESGQSSSPSSISATVSSEATVFIGTFTVSGAFGTIAGTVSDGEGLVTSGALLLASTGTISSTPPLIVASSAPALSPMYAVSSKADGTYELPVRGNYSYYLSVYVPTIGSGGTVSITTKTYSGISVTPSATTTKDVTIP